MSPKYILVERRDRAAVITLNRPETRNAFLNDMVLETREAILAADADPQVRVIVITGKDPAFSSGADVDAFLQAFKDSKRLGYQVHSIDQEQLERFAVELRQVTKPVIAAVNGAAVGLGFTLAIACDIRIASDQARMGAIFLRVGLTPEFGSSYNLTRLAGIARACELVFTAKIVNAQEAKEMGLVNKVVPHKDLMPATFEVAQQIASLPPLAMKLAKANLYNGMDATLLAQSHQELMANHLCRETKDYEEGITAFVEKRQPVFTGR